MENILTFTTTQLAYYFLILFSSFVTFLILGRNLKPLIQNSYKFNHRYFYLGIITSLLSTIVLINWQTTISNTYEVEEIQPEIDRIIIPLTTWPEPKIKLPPPPPEPKLKPLKEIPKTIKIKTVDNPTQVSRAKIRESREEPAPPQPRTIAPPPPMPVPIIEDDPDDTPLLRVDQMPRFPGCENIVGDLLAKKSCAEEQLLKYVYNNVKFPAVAKQNDVYGMAVIQFVVEKDGSVGDVKVIRDPGAGLGSAVEKVVSGMNDLPERWTPGKQKGRPVRVLFTLPVKFELR